LGNLGGLSSGSSADGVLSSANGMMGQMGQLTADQQQMAEEQIELSLAQAMIQMVKTVCMQSAQDIGQG